MLKALLQRPRRVFYGWWIVAAGFVIAGLGSGLYVIGSSVLFLPVSRDLGLSRAAMSLALSLSRAEGALEGPLTGWLIDRLGPRPMIWAGTLLAGAGYILLSQAHSYLAFLVIFLAVISLGTNTGFGHPVVAAVNYWFRQHRGLTMAIVMAAPLGAGAVIAPGLALLIHHWGWRLAVVIAGLAILIVIPPLAFLIRRSPESMGLRPDGAQEERAGWGVIPPEVDFTVRQAVVTSSFWILGIATFFRIGVFSSIIIHFIPLMVWRGVEEGWAAFLLGTMAFLNIPTRIGLGWLGDRVGKIRVMVAVALLGTVMLLLLPYGKEGWHFWLIIIGLAIVEGLSPLGWALIGDFFGRRHYATIRGWMGFIYGFSLAAPIFAGWVYDRTQSYHFVLVVFAALMVMAAMFYAILRPPRRPGA